jgi:hypothetical protein
MFFRYPSGSTAKYPKDSIEMIGPEIFQGFMNSLEAAFNLSSPALPIAAA